MHLITSNCAATWVDYWPNSRMSGGENLRIISPFCPLWGRASRSFQHHGKTENESHERVLSRESSFCAALDGHAVQLPRNPGFRLSIPERAIRHDRPRDRWPSAVARLQHGERQPRGGARVLLDQGAGRSADLAPA